MGVDGGARASSLKVLGKVVFSFSGLQDQGNSYTTKTLHFRRLFSIMPARGISTRIREKYRIDASWPIMMNGCSTGCPPIHVSVSKSATSSQNIHWLRGRNIMLRCLDVWRKGIMSRIRMESARASTPPSLLGMDRRIA